MLNANKYIKMTQYFPTPYGSYKTNVKVELDLSNYAVKTEIKEATSVDTPAFTKKYWFN